MCLCVCVCVGGRVKGVLIKYDSGWETLRKLSEKLKVAGIMMKGIMSSLRFFKSTSSKSRSTASSKPTAKFLYKSYYLFRVCCKKTRKIDMSSLLIKNNQGKPLALNLCD